MAHSTRAQQLAKVGLDQLDFDLTLKLSLTPLVRAIAAMLAEATKPKERAKNPGARADCVRGRAVYDFLRQCAPDAIQWEPAHPNTFSGVGKAVQAAGISEPDLFQLAEYLKQERPRLVWGVLARFIVDWVARARQAQPVKQDDALDKLRRKQGGL